MLSTPKSKGELFLASSLRDGLEDNDIRQVKTLLLSKEADPNVLIPTHGISPFHLVIGNESATFAEEVTKLFLRHGGNPNVRSADGMTPVHVAAAWGRVQVLELLLANGGDPLCLDDDGRSPFHYAFDGSYYNAVSLLGKYCGMNQEEEEEDEAEGPKYKLTLEKILINKGDCVAEYVPSEVSCSISVKTESSGSLESVKREPQVLPAATANFRRNSSPSSDSSPASDGSTADEFSHLNTNNVTFRRHQKRRGPPNTDTNLDIGFGERSVEEERLLIGQIINRLSNTFVNDTSTISKDAITASRKMTKNNKANNAFEIKNTRSFLPPPKYHSCNLTSKKTPRRLLADTSIISKSPNCRIYNNDKTPTPSKIKSFSPTSYTCRSKYFNNNATPPSRSSKPLETRIKSASSTPKRKQYRSRLSGSVKMPKTKKSSDLGLVKKTRTIFDKTYCKDRFGVPSYSPDTEITERKVYRKNLTKNIAIKLDERMYDDNLETRIYDFSPDRKINLESPSNNLVRRLKPLRIYNNIKTEIEAQNAKHCNVASSESKTPSPCNFLQDERVKNKFSGSKQLLPVTPKSANIKFQLKDEEDADFREKEVEKLREFFESPGSSKPVSYSRLEFSNSIARKIEKNLDGDNDEDTKIWLEIEEACRNRCGTPPASVSILDVDNSPNSIHSSPEQVAGTTFYSDYGSEDTSTSEFYEAAMNTPKMGVMPNPGIMASRSFTESFVSVEEEYAYEDAEEGVAFMERHLCVIPSSNDDDKNRVNSQFSWVDQFEELSLVSSGYSPSTSPQGDLKRSYLDDNILRERLTALGEMPGPITKTTFNVYLKRLWRLERAQKKIPKAIQSPSKISRQSNRKTTISRTIPDFLLTTDWTTKLDMYRNMEEQSFKEYATANPNRKYRGGISKTSFCYLLLDPRITRDLPRSGVQLSVEDRWTRFLEGVFYVGKGKAARPAAHLYDAFGVWSKRKQVDNISKKIRRILDIWEDGQGVVCLHVFSHTMVEEACSREAAMIDALDTVHLTNCVRGTYYGYTTTMNVQEKRSLGKYLLYKAMEIFMHEGERQLFPRNVLL